MPKKTAGSSAAGFSRRGCELYVHLPHLPMFGNPENTPSERRKFRSSAAFFLDVPPIPGESSKNDDS